MTYSQPCKTPNCSRDARSLGLCPYHYAVEREKGNTGADPCKGPLCDRFAHTRGMCRAHYHQWIKFGPSGLTPVRRRRKEDTPCVALGCTAMTRGASLLCVTHRMKAQKYQLTSLQLDWISLAPCESCGDLGDTVVDHDHSCCPGEATCGDCIRGVLCRHCNNAMGFLRDDPERALQAHEYLSRVGMG